MPTIFAQDYTGIANEVLGETATVPAGSVKLIVPEQGAFFMGSNGTLTVRAGGVTLTPFLDWVPVHPVAHLIAQTNLDVFLAFAIKKPGVTQVTFDYYAVGGEYSLTQNQINSLIAGNLNTSVDYNDLINLPAGFPPVYHRHFASDIGWSGAKEAIANIGRAVEVGSATALEALYNYIKLFVGNLEFEVDINPGSTKHGMIRHKTTGLTLCFGNIDHNQPSGQVTRQLFRKQFTAKPIIVTGDLNLALVSAGGSISTSVEFKKYNTTATGFFLKNNGTVYGNAEPTLTPSGELVGYLAIGYSVANAPISDVAWTRGSYPSALL